MLCYAILYTIILYYTLPGARSVRAVIVPADIFLTNKQGLVMSGRPHPSMHARAHALTHACMHTYVHARTIGELSVHV